MSGRLLGIVSWKIHTDELGYKFYDLRTKVACSSYNDGPLTVFATPGLPAVGTYWAFGNDNDPWSYCYPTATATPMVTERPNKHWYVDQVFSNKPMHRCQEFQIDNPLAEPPKISGSFSNYMRPVERDRNGKLIKSSSHELITGIQKSSSRPTVIIEMNYPELGLETFSPMVNSLNDSTLWGLGPRKIMLKNASFSRNIYGLCYVYYSIKYEFEVRFEGFDLKDIADKGFKKFRGSTDQAQSGDSRSNPAHYILAQDSQGNNTPKPILLNGNGDPLTDPNNPVFIPTVELDDEANFYTLGIPFSL